MTMVHLRIAHQDSLLAITMMIMIKIAFLIEKRLQTILKGYKCRYYYVNPLWHDTVNI